ncbi:hypothetical protein BSK55_29010 [Paenibacillus odorifer]|nr:hypothetical protein BSK55_29010 [Paenibacillus odorifer]
MLIKEYGIIVSEEINKLFFDIFMKLKIELDKFMNSEYVFIYTSELKAQIVYYISIIGCEINCNYTSTDLNQLFNFIMKIRTT